MTAAEWDKKSNNLVAAGALYGSVPANLDPEIVVVDGVFTNAFTVRFGFMKSRYRVTVERVLGDGTIA